MSALRTPDINAWWMLLFVFGLLSACAHAIEYERGTLTVTTASGDSHEFVIELADTKRKRRRGLMFRENLDASAGMLFDFERVAPVSMWMVNTYISLDMLFIASDGEIVKIAEAVQPLSSEQIHSGVPVRAVLELNAGVAAQLGIGPGDQISHPLFKAGVAVPALSAGHAVRP